MVMMDYSWVFYGLTIYFLDILGYRYIYSSRLDGYVGAVYLDYTLIA